jgi:hypothetical protein
MPSLDARPASSAPFRLQLVSREPLTPQQRSCLIDLAAHLDATGEHHEAERVMALALRVQGCDA